jgi:hypothetical protein
MIATGSKVEAQESGQLLVTCDTEEYGVGLPHRFGRFQLLLLPSAVIISLLLPPPPPPPPTPPLQPPPLPHQQFLTTEQPAVLPIINISIYQYIHIPTYLGQRNTSKCLPTIPTSKCSRRLGRKWSPAPAVRLHRNRCEEEPALPEMPIGTRRENQRSPMYLRRGPKRRQRSLVWDFEEVVSSVRSCFSLLRSLPSNWS